ncbi:MAG: response regulator [Elusimicrobia bacterium]|nr:response regulator [Elusimicrobiota bacterium]
MSEPARKRRLLIIDDDDSLRELFEFSMEQEGFQVAQAADGILGLAKTEAFNPDLIVLDLMMPNLNGFETLHRLQLGEHAKIPVIVITGYNESASAHIVRQEPNVVEFLVKPIEYAALAETIRRLLA